MRAWVEEVDSQHEAHIHAADRRDIDIIKEHCTALRSAGMTGSKDEKHAMTCDGFTIMEWCNRKGIQWRDFWRERAIQTRFLEDTDNAAFRVWTGKV